MGAIRRIDLENDGLNLASGGERLYARCRRAVHVLDAADLRPVAERVIFKKDGKSRNIAASDRYIILTDFCDLLVLDKRDLSLIKEMRLGQDLSSDLGVVRCDENAAYINIRNGRMTVLDFATLTVKTFDICEESSWEHGLAGERIYTGTVSGGLIETDKASMRLLRRIRPHAKNIYSVVYDEGLLYTVSQDRSIQAVDAATLAVVRTAKRAVQGMARIIGVHRDWLVIANNGISLWDKRGLTLLERLDIPSGPYNKGALLAGRTVIGSDVHGIYAISLEE